MKERDSRGREDGKLVSTVTVSHIHPILIPSDSGISQDDTANMHFIYMSIRVILFILVEGSGWGDNRI